MSKSPQLVKSLINNNKNALYYLLLTAGLFFLFKDYLLLNRLYIFEDIGNDTLALFYPTLLDMVRTFNNEGIPFWSFAKGIGHASFSPNFFNPFHWIYLIGGLENVAFLIGWVQFLKVLFTAFCAHHLFKLQGLSNTAVLLSTTLLAFSGYLIVGSAWYGHSTNIMFMVVFLLGLELLFVRNKWWLIPIAVIFLLGPRLLFVMEFAVIYTVLRFALMDRVQWSSVLQFFQRLLLPIGLGILFIAPFIGRILYKFIYSPRVGGGMSSFDGLSSRGIFELVSQQELTTSFFRFFSNDILGTANNFVGWNNYLEAPLFYCGLISLLLLPQIFIFVNRKKKVIVASVLLFWLLVLVFPYLRHAFYFFAGNYYKSALSLFIPVTVITLSGAAFHYILKERRINIVLLVLTLATLIAGLYLVPSTALKGEIDNSLRNTTALILLLQTLVLLTIHFYQKHDLSYLLLLFVLFEGVFMSYKSTSSRSDIPVSRQNNRNLYNDSTLDVLAYINRTDSGFFRIEKNFASIMSGLNEGQAQGFYGTRSYDSHNHNNYISFLNSMDLIDLSTEYNTRWLMGFPQSNQLHPLFSIKYLIANQSTKAEVSSFFYEDIGEMGGLEIFKSKYFIPFGIPISAVSTNSDLKSLDTYFKKIQLHYLSIILPDEEVLKFPALERLNMDYVHGALAFEKYKNDYAPKAMKISSFEQDDIKGSIALDRASIVLYTMPFDSGWKAYVNGKKKELIKVDNGLTGLYLEEGNYDIRLKYRPPFFFLGSILFIAGLILYLILLVKRKGTAEEQQKTNLLPPDLV